MHILTLCFTFSFTLTCVLFLLGEPGGRIVEFYKSAKEPLGLSLTVGPNSSLSISYIQPGSAAGKAPLRIGDRVLTINGTGISDQADAQVSLSCVLPCYLILMLCPFGHVSLVICLDLFNKCRKIKCRN